MCSKFLCLFLALTEIVVLSGSSQSLDGGNRAIVIAESLARVIPAIRIASVPWRSHLPPQYTAVSPHTSCVPCAAIRIAQIRAAQLALVGFIFVPRGIAEWPAYVFFVPPFFGQRIPVF